LQNDELHNEHHSPDIIRVIKSRKMRWVWHVARAEEMRNAYTILVRNFEDKRPRGEQMSRWEDNI